MINPHAGRHPVQFVNPEPQKRPKLTVVEQIRAATGRIRELGADVDQQPDEYYALFEPVVGAAIAQLLDGIADDVERNAGMPSPEWLPALTIAKLINSGVSL